MRYPWPLKYWDSGEFQVVREKLDDLRDAGITINPTRSNMFTALSLVKPQDIRCVIVGQDPYPNPLDATGVAFHVPPDRPVPASLSNIFDEYCSDLHYPRPATGDLSKWISEGVLLWNAVPSCTAWKPGSHDWDEWTYLTKEIIEKLDKENACVFIFLGKKAQAYAKYAPNSEVILTSHPSPMGVNWGFNGSRIFSRANAYLRELGEEPINWRLDDGHESVQDRQRSHGSSIQTPQQQGPDQAVHHV